MTNEITVPASIKGKFNLALTQSKFQQLQDKADSLIYDEDHLQEISSFLKDLREVGKNIDNTHKSGKEEALRIGREWDAARKVFMLQVSLVETKAQAEFSRICREVQDRTTKQEQEKKRISDIKSGIENNVIKFSSDIASCTTSKSLTQVESLINLEKSRTTKYQEFIELAKEKFTELNSLLATQKVRVKELEKIEEEEKEAQGKNDEEVMIMLQEKREAVESKIEEAKIVVQETAINQSINNEVEVADIIYPTIKARRTVFTWEPKDLMETLKKKPEWVYIETNGKLIDEYLKEKRKEGVTEEFEFAGIRFFLNKTY